MYPVYAWPNTAFPADVKLPCYCGCMLQACCFVCYDDCEHSAAWEIIVYSTRYPNPCPSARWYFASPSPFCDREESSDRGPCKFERSTRCVTAIPLEIYTVSCRETLDMQIHAKRSTFSGLLTSPVIIIGLQIFSVSSTTRVCFVTVNVVRIVRDGPS